MLQRISRTLVLGLISVSFVSGQIDTLDAVSYLPMQIGNKWQYHYYASGEDFGFVLWEITDIVTKDNGLTYFEFNPRLYHTGWFPVRHHLRIDTTTLSVMSYDQGEGCPNNEMKIADLAPADTSEYTDTCFHFTEYPDSAFYISELNLYSHSYHIYNINNDFVLSEGIGFTYQYSFDHPWNNFKYQLSAAQIDSVQYGDFVSTVEQANQPKSFKVDQNYPNPFNPTTTISYELPQQSDVQITIYNLLGKQVTTLLSETQDAGLQSIQWNATNVPSGMYFYQIRAGDYVQTRKMVLLK